MHVFSFIFKLLDPEQPLYSQVSKPQAGAAGSPSAYYCSCVQVGVFGAQPVLELWLGAALLLFPFLDHCSLKAPLRE